MILTAIVFGLASSLHCIGMCGPIALMLPLDRKNLVVQTIQLLSYHTGRLAAYGFLGALFGILGRGFYLAGMQQQLSVFIGLMIIALMTLPFIAGNFSRMSRPVMSLIASVKSNLGKRLHNKTPRGLFMLGILNGFLPCGLVYAALFGALAMQGILLGTIYMVLFGLGTVPMMAGVSVLAVKISDPFRNRLRAIVPATAVIIGVLFILRGLGLGIPYISPTTTNLFVKATAQCH